MLLCVLKNSPISFPSHFMCFCILLWDPMNNNVLGLYLPFFQCTCFYISTFFAWAITCMIGESKTTLSPLHTSAHDFVVHIFFIFFIWCWLVYNFSSFTAYSCSILFKCYLHKRLVILLRFIVNLCELC